MMYNKLLSVEQAINSISRTVKKLHKNYKTLVPETPSIKVHKRLITANLTISNITSSLSSVTVLNQFIY